ncbi:START domain-containing protein [Puia sp.]|jgi:hypothetical protein|uniref:START domain-containing protein n=1 Tax=Puia sp. TaxID=2045100 RepID=UPI002F42B787
MTTSLTYRSLSPSRSIPFPRTLLLFALVAATLFASAQPDWQLRTERKDIKVYTRTYPDSKYKAIKVELILQSTLSRLVSVLLDVKTAPEWVYATKSAVLLKQVSPSELIYYSEVKLPWPMSNRDFIARLITTQDPATRIVTINGPTLTDYVPEKKEIVRVKRSEGKWLLTPVGREHIRVEYTLRTDPGGDIPAWLFNLFVTKGPLESFENLKAQLNKPEYAHCKLPFIVD